ncbi:hypothetical protein CEUSTIGMA_g9470.t1 [Chlamydomonas eustigma]|uniref:Chlorophyll a-b binding protein, chloroplastic n=1 Tax=Chlamydomonas eustigma TaxID=1157962 RepID=A0A250XGJ4_9CHLO|nr:hypothetical protein CEUSTIGMA_g9470.t1 [Chlamydomonas eustigma]|eukprot:GAX82042.1 hypothetical protein CEUSTIGMA_g9470.t1 [Chlamydomonas eustigma]
MAVMMKSSFGQQIVAGRSARRSTIQPRNSVRASAADPASRPLWFPGNPAPEYLDGTLPGDSGFDPLGLSSDADLRKWLVQAELQNARWAMLGVAGILFTSVGAQAGLGYPQWYDAGEVAIKNSPIPFNTLLVTQLILFHWVETKRIQDFKNPGSQGDGSFFGVTTEFKGKEVGYPGGRFFDPMGMAEGPKYAEYKQKEITNGRLAMTAFAGFIAQHAATGKGPIENLVDHLASPYTTTFATNGVSVPFAP